MSTSLVLSLLLLGQTLSADEILTRLQRQGMCRIPAQVPPWPDDTERSRHARGVLLAALDEEGTLPEQCGVSTLRLIIDPSRGDTVVVRASWATGDRGGEVVTKVLSGNFWSEAGLRPPDSERLSSIQKRALTQLSYDADVLWNPGTLSMTTRLLDAFEVEVLALFQREAASMPLPSAPGFGGVDLGIRDGSTWTFEWSDGDGVTVREANSPTRGALFELGLRLLELSGLPPTSAVFPNRD